MPAQNFIFLKIFLKKISEFYWFLQGQLSNMTTGVAEYGKAAKLLFRCLYTSDETRGRSITGGSQTAGGRKGLEDVSKLSVIYGNSYIFKYMYL